MLQVLFQDLQGAELLLLVFDDRLWGDHLLGHARCDQHKIFLADLHPTLLGIELANAHSIARLFQIELFRLALRELDHVQPSDRRSIFTMRL